MMSRAMLLSGTLLIRVGRFIYVALPLYAMRCAAPRRHADFATRCCRRDAQKYARYALFAAYYALLYASFMRTAR